jgi:hypothetical protein
VLNEHPILFSAEMVRAILDGRKTQTRRVITPQPEPCDIELPFSESVLEPSWWSNYERWDGVAQQMVEGDVKTRWWHCPYGRPGDRLWVRENWNALMAGSWTEHRNPTRGNCEVRYAASDRLADMTAKDRGYRWRPSIHMPRWASRITLEITAVRVERIQQISHEDGIAEGIDAWIDSLPQEKRNGDVRAQSLSLKQLAYSYLWDSINGKRGFGWDKNPWVWVVEFKRVA